MNQRTKRTVLAAGIIAAGIAVAGACYITATPVCVPAGTVLISDESIIPPCTQVTDQIVTGADAYAPQAVGVDCGGQASQAAATIDNVVPLEEISAVRFPPPNSDVCDVTTTPVGTTTIPCNGYVAVGDQCAPCGE